MLKTIMPPGRRNLVDMGNLFACRRGTVEKDQQDTACIRILPKFSGVLATLDIRRAQAVAHLIRCQAHQTAG